MDTASSLACVGHTAHAHLAKSAQCPSTCLGCRAACRSLGVNVACEILGVAGACWSLAEIGAGRLRLGSRKVWRPVLGLLCACIEGIGLSAECVAVFQKGANKRQTCLVPLLTP